MKYDLEHEPPVGTVLRMTFPTSIRRTKELAEPVSEIIVHLDKGWIRTADGYIGSWDLYAINMVMTAAKVEVAEFRTVQPVYDR